MEAVFLTVYGFQRSVFSLRMGFAHPYLNATHSVATLITCKVSVCHRQNGRMISAPTCALCIIH